MSLDIPVPTVGLVLTNLLPMIEAQVQPGPDGGAVLVCYGETGPYAPKDIIQIHTNIRRTLKPEDFMGGYQYQSMNESYELNFTVSTWTGSTDHTVPLQRVYELVGYVESAVRTDPTIGGVILDAHPSGSTGGNPMATTDPTGLMSTVDLVVSVLTLN